MSNLLLCDYRHAGIGDETMWQCALCEASEKGTAVERAGPKALICSWCAKSLARRSCGFCRNCQTAQPLPMGTAHKGAWCRACDKAYMRAKYERNRDARLAYQREYHRKNQARELAQWAIYRAANRLLINERQRARYAANPEQMRARFRQWADNNQMRNRQRSQAWYSEHREDKRLYRARRKLAILMGWK